MPKIERLGWTPLLKLYITKNIYIALFQFFPHGCALPAGIFNISINLHLHYTAPHCHALHWKILPHYSTVYFTALNYLLDCPALQCTSFHYTTLQYHSLHYTTVYWTALHYRILHCPTLQHTALHYITVYFTALHCT